MIKAVVFDMDGVLIDSEPFWREAEEKVFRSIGLPFKANMGKETTGLRIDHVVPYWLGKFHKKHPDHITVAVNIVKETIRLIKKQGQLKKGVKETFQFFVKKKMKIALASSSPMEMIQTVIKKLGIHHHFEIVHSAEYEAYPKPHPDVFLTVARKLKVSPSACLVIEDSPRGVEAAKRAGMKCLAIPDSSQINNKKIKLADYIFSSLKEVNEEFWKQINT